MKPRKPGLGPGANRDPKIAIMRQALAAASTDKFTLGGRIRKQRLPPKVSLAPIKFGSGDAA